MTSPSSNEAAFHRPALGLSTEPPGSARAWIGAARLRTLPAAVAPVAVGVGCAHAAGAVAWAPAVAALVGALLIQIGTNFANDVFDAEKGADTPDRKGPVRAVAAGLITARAMRRAMIATFALAVAVGGYLAWVGGWPIVAIGVASIAAGVLYTGGPWPLGYHGLGDVFVMIFFGQVAVCGTTYVALGHVTWLALALSVPVGAIATAIIVVNNLRDRATDEVAGKRTLAVRWGRRFALIEYATLLAIAHAVPLVLAATGRPLLALGALTAPLAWWRTQTLARASRERAPAGPDLTAEGRATGPLDQPMNALLAATAQLLLVQAALLTAALVGS